MDRPSSVETVVEEKFRRLQNEKTEWVNMGSAIHQVRVGLQDVVDTDTLALRFLPEDDPSTRLLDLGLVFVVFKYESKLCCQALAQANYLSTSIPV